MDNKCYSTCEYKKNETVSKDSNISHGNRATELKKMPMPPKNGGLYGGPQVNHPWMPQPVIPTETNLIMNNLKSANPPPGATSQFVSTLRYGNNYVSMPNVYKFNEADDFNCGPYNLHGSY